MSTPVAVRPTTIVVMNTTGEKLRYLRGLAQESQDDAARVARVKKQAISKIERDLVAEPGAKTMYRLAKHYNVSLGWLLGLDQNKVSPSSETVRLEAGNVGNTLAALEAHYRRHGMVLDLKSDRDAERFVQLYQMIAVLPKEPTADNLIELGSKLEAIAPMSEGGKDGRTNSLSVGREGSGIVAGGRSRD